jgi:hypothetical protein
MRDSNLIEQSSPLVKDIEVPCNGCTLCCHKDAVRLVAGVDDFEAYQTEPHPTMKGEVMLAHKPNGDCIYLEPGVGCSIHGMRPSQCRGMDCRTIAGSLTYTMQRKLVAKKMLRPQVLRKGKMLLREGKSHA